MADAIYRRKYPHATEAIEEAAPKIDTSEEMQRRVKAALKKRFGNIGGLDGK